MALHFYFAAKGKQMAAEARATEAQLRLLQWLVRIEEAQQTYPGDAVLQYLAGVACVHLQLWGKAHQLLKLALPRLQDVGLETRAWQMLAELAQRRGDEAEAAVAWRSAAQVRLRRKA